MWFVWHDRDPLKGEIVSQEQVEILLKYLSRLTPRGREEENELLWVIHALRTTKVTPIR